MTSIELIEQIKTALASDDRIRTLVYPKFR